MRVAVFGLWHLGCVTAACVAAAGNSVIGLDLDEGVVEALRRGEPPLHEPGLQELIAAGLAQGQLSFTTRPEIALRSAEVLWVTFDTPVDERDRADVAFVRAQLEAIAATIEPGTLVVVSSQVPVGFTRTLDLAWPGRALRFAYVPENLRVGQAIESFRKPERVVVGFRDATDQPKLMAIFAPFCSRLEWMSVESAEMTKHALNAFLATSVTFINELARLCEALGADAKEVERGLKSDGRIGSRAYLAPGGPIAGGTLVRDVRFLTEFGQRHRVGAPLLDGVLVSNEAHKDWMHRRTEALLGGSAEPVVAVLGLTYKPGTSTLRRSHAVEFCAWLRARGARVQAHDPAVVALPEELCSLLTLCRTPREALTGADLAVIATEWPDFRKLTAEEFVEVMRRPQVIDQTWFLAPALAADRRITYVATGRPDTRPATGAATT